MTDVVVGEPPAVCEITLPEVLASALQLSRSRKTRAISLIVEPLDLEMGLLAVKDV